MKKTIYEVVQGWLNKNNDGEFETLKSFENFFEAWKYFNEVKGNKHQEKITDNTPFYKLSTELLESIYEVEEDEKEFISSKSVASFEIDFRPSVLRK